MLTLYRKYRPKKFSQIQGQSPIIRTLTNSIINERIGHAYLLTGPRGTGKTTIARIFAKTINCIEPIRSKEKTATVRIEPCDKCINCRLVAEDKAMDIIEIDAASHTGVDNIRQLKESVVLPPTSFKYKVYIIDEVHMLSIGAFNALLKTLEEPPAHAVFILATTELHKVPETIISRCQRFDIAHLTQKQIVERLEELAKKEKVEVENEALETIALEAEGGMRDAESLLGQIIALEDKSITTKEVNEILGTSSKRMVSEFATLMMGNNIQRTLEKLDSLQKEGINLKNLTKNLLSYFRGVLITKTSPENTKLILVSFSKEFRSKIKELSEKVSLEEAIHVIELLQKSLNMLKDTTIPQLPLEMALIEQHLKKNPESNKSPLQSPATQQMTEEVTEDSEPETREEKNKTTKEEKEKKKEEESPKKQQNSIEKVESVIVPTKQKIPEQTDNVDIELTEIIQKWSEILEEVKPHNHSINAFLENCTPCGILDETLYIKTKYDFYKDKLSESGNKLTIQKVVAKISGAPLKIVFANEKECASMKFPANKNPEKNNVLHDAMKVFGGKITK